jgi:hypothetical protein
VTIPAGKAARIFIRYYTRSETEIAEARLETNKKAAPDERLFFYRQVIICEDRLNYLNDLAGLEAAGADLDVLDLAVYLSLDPEEVRAPGPPRTVLGMGNGVAKGRALAADIAFSRHDFAPQGLVEAVYLSP